MHFLFALLLAFFVVACGDDESSFAPRDDEPTSSSRESVTPQSSSSVDSIGSSSLQNDKSSSSSKVPEPVDEPVELVEGSSVTPTSSSSAKSSSSSVPLSSSEYVPFDHAKTLGYQKFEDDGYKTFTDPRNGRSYYYITIYSEYKGYSVTVMAENLNIGDMVLGENDQNDDTKIERYCYNNDTTKCDEFGGLYQWAEMMQLPSRCNTESCADLIQENHQGICPDGWRLFTYDDYCVVMGYEDINNDGVKGLRSTYGFSGTNSSGFSLVGAGLRNTNGTFSGLKDRTAWFRPEEYAEEPDIRAHHGLIGSSGSAPQQNHRELKAKGFSVRCVMVENQAE